MICLLIYCMNIGRSEMGVFVMLYVNKLIHIIHIKMNKNGLIYELMAYIYSINPKYSLKI